MLIPLRSVEVLYAQGHPNVLAKHPTAFEITMDTELTRRGDCVIGVNANKAPLNFSDEFKKLCRLDESTIRVELEAAGISDSIEGNGSAKLTFSHNTESVGRTSSYVSDRTIMVQSDKAARDLNRELIDALTHRGTKLRVRIIAEL
jgi:hypothetical protein